MNAMANSGSGDAVQTAINIATPLLGALVGAVSGVVLAFVVGIALRVVFRRARVISAMLHRTRGPAYWVGIAWGAYIGMRIALINESVFDAPNGTTISLIQRLAVLVAIGMTTWLAFSAAWIVEDAARLRSTADLGRARRFETQAQVLRRFLQALIVVVGISWGLFTLPGAQKAVGTVLASAGVISVIAGLAAQSTLGNAFAGIQLAFTDAIRVGDVVVAGTNGDQGAIEEITLTYVVVRVWDERRLIIPSSQFTTNQFENWTRRATKQLGTVELTLDWAAPVAEIRERVERLLLATDLWDGRSWNVQVTDSDRDTVTVRILVSAKDSGTLWDLRCYLRENLVGWLATDESWTRPVLRHQAYQAVTVAHDPSGEMVARLASELSGIAGTDTAGGQVPLDEGGAAPGGGIPPRAGGPGAGAASAGTSGVAVAGAGAASTPSGSVRAGSQEPAGTRGPAGGAGAGGQVPVDAVHAARLTAARRKAKRARRHRLVQRQRDAAEGRRSAGGEATSVLSPASPSAPASAPASDAERTRVFTREELRQIAERYDPSTARALTGGREGGQGATRQPAAEQPADQRGASRQDATGQTATGRTATAQAPTSQAPTSQAPTGPGPGGPGTAAQAPSPAVTAVLPAVTTTSGGRGERLYSGSPDAEERAEIFRGPGTEALAEREEAAQRRAQHGGPLKGSARPPSPAESPTTDADTASGGTPSGGGPSGGTSSGGGPSGGTPSGGDVGSGEAHPDE